MQGSARNCGRPRGSHGATSNPGAHMRPHGAVGNHRGHRGGAGDLGEPQGHGGMLPSYLATQPLPSSVGLSIRQSVC